MCVCVYIYIYIYSSNFHFCLSLCSSTFFCLWAQTELHRRGSLWDGKRVDFGVWQGWVWIPPLRPRSDGFPCRASAMIKETCVYAGAHSRCSMHGNGFFWFLSLWTLNISGCHSSFCPGWKAISAGPFSPKATDTSSRKQPLIFKSNDTTHGNMTTWFTSSKPVTLHCLENSNLFSENNKALYDLTFVPSPSSNSTLLLLPIICTHCDFLNRASSLKLPYCRRLYHQNQEAEYICTWIFETLRLQNTRSS